MDRRKPDETFEDYKKRLKEQAKAIKEYLKGQVFWPSSISGTWVRPKAVHKKEDKRKYKI